MFYTERSSVSCSSLSGTVKLVDSVYSDWGLSVVVFDISQNKEDGERWDCIEEPEFTVYDNWQSLELIRL
jgi:hypothetical protein